MKVARRPGLRARLRLARAEPGERQLSARVCPMSRPLSGQVARLWLLSVRSARPMPPKNSPVRKSSSRWERKYVV